MPTFRLKVTTPEDVFFDDEVEEIVLRTTSGDKGILDNHINYLAVLRIGKLIIKKGKETKEATISGGVVEVSESVTTILTPAAEWCEEIDKSRAELAKKRAEEKLKANLSSKHEERIQEAAIRRAVNRINNKP